MRVLARTAAPPGYAHYCAPAGQSNPGELEELQRTHTEAMANLATATAADRQAVGALTQTNAQLTLQLQTLIEQMNAANATIALLQRQTQCQPVAAQQPATNPTVPRRNNRPQQNRAPLDPNGYCWTHGYRVSTLHSSATCENQAPGHQCGATRANTMGGSDKNKPE